MISKIILNNFQIHKKLELNFEGNFTIISGENDSGKSSIIRAIKWVLTNSPSGDWMRRILKSGELTTTEVKIVYKDGTIIKRIKGEGINKYEVDGEEYENFGFKIPEPVLEAIKIYPFKTNKEEFDIHLAMQEDKPFLVFDSSTIKASVVDTLTGNSLIQKSITSFNKENLQLSKDVTSLENSINENKSVLESLPDVTKSKELVIECKNLSKQINLIESSVLDLKNTCADYKEVQTICTRRSKQAINIEPLSTLLNQYKDMQDDLTKFLDIKEQLDECKIKDIEIPKINPIKIDFERLVLTTNDLQSLEFLLESIKETEIKEIKLPDIKLIEENLKFLTDIKYEILKLEEDFNELSVSNNEIDGCNGIMKESEIELKQFIKDNPICPTCGANIK